MNDLFLNIEFKAGKSYQQQIREKLVELITSDQFGDRPLPSSRKMAQQLGVSRNTVVLVYESLVDEGYLVAHERSGFFVNPEVKQDSQFNLVQLHPQQQTFAPKWNQRLSTKPSDFSTLDKDKAWMSYEFPFIYGQIDTKDFPIYQWRECARASQSRNSLHEWVEDYVDADDPELITQIRQQVLSKRGITAQPDEILLTMGTQNSLFLLASLLSNSNTVVGIENPGWPDFHHAFHYAGAKTKPIRVDEQGISTGKALKGCDYVCVTPSHHYPTTVTMSMERRKALLQQASTDDFVIIEDDYDSEVNFSESPLPALKSLDTNGRVVYTGSLSKSLSPGIRTGYLVADKDLIKELRALRRLNYRHPPTNNQRVTAQFIAQGYHDAHIRRMRKVLESKWTLMDEGLKNNLNDCRVFSTPGSFCFWIELPEQLPSQLLVEKAAEQRMLVESGDKLFAGPNPPRNYIRLGFTAIAAEKIEPGIIMLGDLIRQLSGSCHRRKNAG
ncbi:PLP-dependent aminotransferase family protein [Reinekea marinisedimentorum]|uniref:GntR family transcriptional regulator/MocR family aminotransferase n=1 Tax=Reinekea marinisedimentorum TaxID=230495 RepID=A0A4R3IBX7_9GAMM|nr:PLP-dependent aminotransferase family protein [Reinekea marinisedimentorum]TCS43125.1 GntR family transcriptional regulator/MocR family aminotransferase [Reinekea marinisedimentorum]